jgi:GntP family gluconate:H+ symporter
VDPAVIVLLGTLVMVGCLLGLRWHAFLSLLLGALTVAMLTPTARRERQALRPATTAIERWDRATGELQFQPRARPPAEGRVVLLSEAGDWSHPLGTALLLASKSGGTNAWHLTELKTESGNAIPETAVRLIPAPQYQQQRQVASAHPMARVAEGFGATCRSIGFLILLASILGRCLSESRAADRIVLWIRQVLGDSRAPQGFAVSGFLLAIPSFFDTVFYLLMPLGRGLAAQTRRDFLLYTLTIVAGATMAHSLVPPTPGPLFVANELGVTLGQMMLGGVVVGGSSVVVGVAYARWANRRWPLPLRPETEAATASSHAASSDSRDLPPLLFSFLPILVPIGLIALAELRKAFVPNLVSLAWLETVGQGQTALLLGTGIALVLAASRLSWDWKRVAPFVSQAVSSGSSLLMITAGGGALGAVIRQTDIADQLSSVAGGGGFRLLIAAFGITALIRIVQGSATVAMITAAGILAPIAAATPPPFHPVYLALAIGCGSKPVPWLNDSGFWIISRMSGMNETETLRSASVMMSLMGCVGFGVVLLGAWLLPLR